MKERLLGVLSSPRIRSLSLYIHIPFCAKKCGYCDFYSLPLPVDQFAASPAASSAASPAASRQEKARVLDSYLDALILDIETFLGTFIKTSRDAPPEIPTVYIGGGTPSVLGAARLKRLLDALSSLLPRAAPACPKEITLEVNPESADEALLRIARDGGVSRLSMGIQSFKGETRAAIGRGRASGIAGSGEAGLLLDRLALARDVFGKSLSVDLMAGLPEQDEAAVISDIENALAYEPGHVSLYSLSLEEGVPLYRQAREGIVALPETVEAEKLWITGRDFLEAAGYSQYEVSNFAPPGREGLHNIRYWLMGNWLGLGPGASGTFIDDEKGEGLRFTVAPDVEPYLARKDKIKEEFLDRPTLIRESLLMGFRYREGPDAVLFGKRFKNDICGFIPATIASWREKGLMRNNDAGGLALNRDGLLFLNEFLISAFRELDELKEI